jgi:tRNA-5-taurinomethyluridine 2-sulfurtransferase
LFHHSDFLNDYKQGWTPNPDILCNKNIKFNLFFKHAMENLKCHAIATGHYACSSFGPFLENFDDKSEVRLLQATDSFKDQTFFLSQIHQSALRHCMFPIGYLNKHQVKEICTNEIGLPQITQKKESIGICFIGDRSFMNFIEEYIEPKPGNFVDIDNGKIVGKHKGIHCYTLGQRVGIGGVPKPYFVYRKNPETSDIFVASGTDHHLMYSDIFFTKNPCWIRKSPFNEKSYIQCQFRFQHTKPLVDCKIVKANFDESKILVLLNEPLRSITPGQYAVFYKDNECLGSSRIFEFSSIIK